ncbi:MAG TPA: helix-turn-helix transcriptional regulator [Novosphingobium sp.]|nr:helix-turn-helix transcriptional regulator [Novosphingobium sp.]
MGSKKEFAKRLMCLREKAGLSRRELARKVQVTHPCIWHWEEGGALPRQKNLQALATVLDVTPDFLRFGEDYLNDLNREIIQAKRRIADRAGLEPARITIVLDQ